MKKYTQQESTIQNLQTQNQMLNEQLQDYEEGRKGKMKVQVMSDYDTESQGTEMMEVASMRSFSSAGSSKFASQGLQKKLKAVKETEAEQDPNSGTRTSRRSRLFSNDRIPTMEELCGEAPKPVQ